MLGRAQSTSQGLARALVVAVETVAVVVRAVRVAEEARPVAKAAVVETAVVTGVMEAEAEVEANKGVAEVKMVVVVPKAAEAKVGVRGGRRRRWRCWRGRWRCGRRGW